MYIHIYASSRAIVLALPKHVVAFFVVWYNKSMQKGMHVDAGVPFVYITAEIQLRVVVYGFRVYAYYAASCVI